MNARRLRQLVVIALLALAVAAGWLLPRYPLAAGFVIALLVIVAALQWWKHRVDRRLLDAALRCDVNALSAMATDGNLFTRARAAVVAYHHGAFDAEPVSFCICGQCEKDALTMELEAIRAIARESWRGDAQRAYDLATRDAVLDERLSPLMREWVAQLRLLNRLIAYAALSTREALSAEERQVFAEIRTFAKDHWPALQWPVRLAAAREAVSRADVASVRALLTSSAAPAADI